MISNKKPVQISDEVYDRYIETAKEMDRLIHEAEISYRQIEQIRKQPLGKIGRLKRMRLMKRKKTAKILVE